jgi:hypothetical protein
MAMQPNGGISFLVSPDNYGSYSIELTKLLLSIGSEIDVVAKLLCKDLKTTKSPDNIIEYQKILCAKFPGLPNVEISIPRYTISFEPWHDWLQNKTPVWWNCYNRVKHARDKYFRDGNLENVLFATGGLCVLISYLYYNDFISKNLGITPLFMFLDRKYVSGCKVLTKGNFKLPDF